MNCDQFTAALDDCDLAALPAAQRGSLSAHAAGCRDCAQQWEAFELLGAADVPPVPPELPARVGAALHAHVARRRGGHAPGRRAAYAAVLRWGSFAALAAAAAMLALLLRPGSSTAPDPLVQVAEVQADPAPFDAQVRNLPVERAAELAPAMPIETSLAAVFTVRVIPPEFPATAEMAREFLSQPPPNNPLSLEALREEWLAYANDAAMQPVLQSLHASMIEELRRIPGLAIVGSDPVEVTAATRHYRVQIRPAADIGSDGHISRRDHRYMAFLTAEQLLPGGRSAHRLSTTSLIDPLAACSGTATVADTPCTDARGTAASMVRKLRQSVFPPDSSVRAPLQAKFQDSSLDPAQRLQALAELYKLQARSGDRTLLQDAGLVNATIELATTADPIQKVQLWRSMRGVGNADLIEPLIASLQQDSDEVRLAAADTLAADFRDDPRARAALELASVGDTKALVRAVAQRGLSGEEEWKRYVLASLHDTSLPAARRVEAFVYYLYPPGPVAGSDADNANYWDILEQLDDQSVRSLAEALPDAGRLQAGNQGLLLISNFGYRYSQHPAVTGMLLRYLEHDPWARYRTVAGEVLARTRGSQPQVRDALMKAIDSDPDPSVRDWIRKIMAEGAQ